MNVRGFVFCGDGEFSSLKNVLKVLYSEINGQELSVKGTVLDFSKVEAL